MNFTKRKGIILAGGSGTRLYPLTRAVCKQLLPVYDKPMVYYALSTLMLSGIRDILIITSPQSVQQFQSLLLDGSQWGISLQYAVQDSPRGIADAMLVAADFLRGGPSALILGDNIFYGDGLMHLLQQADLSASGAVTFAYWVQDPERYGVVEFDREFRATNISEKPVRPTSNYAITGLYFYDGAAPEYATRLRPSARGELEITDLNRIYLDQGRLTVERFGRGFAWLDAGTHDSLLQASQFIQVVEQRQGLKIACPEEIAFRQGYIDARQLEALADGLGKSSYGDYLRQQLIRIR